MINRRKKKHVKSKKYACDRCNKGFPRRDSLIRYVLLELCEVMIRGLHELMIFVPLKKTPIRWLSAQALTKSTRPSNEPQVTRAEHCSPKLEHALLHRWPWRQWIEHAECHGTKASTAKSPHWPFDACSWPTNVRHTLIRRCKKSATFPRWLCAHIHGW